MRYKEFNRNAVLEKSIPLFWKYGFSGCPVSEIVEETGVNRYSLYEEFENKNGLVLASMNLFKDRYADQKIEILKEEGNTEEILNHFYNSFLDKGHFDRGCYIVHIGTEISEADSKVKQFFKSYLEEIEALFNQLLSNDDRYKDKHEFYSKNLIGLFCTSTSFCLIQDLGDGKDHIKNGIQVILNN